ncbi:TetR/AcrR family transcriptional regulator [Pallidibacillus pasinlerensis]|uniref:TetR/AcrR family transcriptional regulator n=1 Tax=Pallidibacillus pasinlerensis TaxID=2703818 RepID=A0ABX0A4K9_9BACI|nr:TetR/AcrR family transcriptional regulator [Pallidibacillus pasinlerensis]NCU18373.1 TetR/AcrR family transcriptional regulator [Pallidibacillus pasinlerensis]
MSLREKKTAKKKADILRSAVEVIAEKGYHATTMEDIAAKLLMTKGSVYYYFKDKQDLLYQSYKMLLEQSNKMITEIINMNLPIKEKLEKVMKSHIVFIISERSSYGLKVKPEHYFEGEQLEIIFGLQENYANSFDQLIEEGIQAKIFSEVDVKIVRNLIIGAMNWVIQWYSTEGKKSAEEMAEIISEYLMKILIRS